MTKKEITEIFSVMMLAWPNAEMFKGGIQKLEPTIRLWTTCLGDVDFWTAQQAVVKLCQECKFPPTIAEFKEKAETVTAEIKKRIDIEMQCSSLGVALAGSVETYYHSLPQGDTFRVVVDAIGGPDKWSYGKYEAMFQKMVKREPTLNIGQRRAMTSPVEQKKGGPVSG